MRKIYDFVTIRIPIIMMLNDTKYQMENFSPIHRMEDKIPNTGTRLTKIAVFEGPMRLILKL